MGYPLASQGRKIRADETFNVSGIEKTNKIDWTYDTAGRLIQEVFDHYDDTLDQTQEWEYDLVGNRTLQKLDKGNDSIWDAFTTYDYDVNDRLITEIFDDLTSANKDRITQYGYDHTQQTYKSVSENGTKLNETTFEYDAQGRMSIVTITMFAEDGTKTRIERTSYDYGTDGIRVRSLHEIDADANGVFETQKETKYLNDPLNITGYSQVLKQTETNLVTGEQANITYIIGRNRIAQITVKDNTEQELYFTFDGHGSTRVLTDLAGVIVELYAFDAYGNAIGFDPSVALTEFLYSGEQFDSKIGQQYLRARYYDPVTGRFNRLDTFFGDLDDPQSLHKYLYTHADPINGIDPNGLEYTIGGISVSSGIGGKLASGISFVATKTLPAIYGQVEIWSMCAALWYFANEQRIFIASTMAPFVLAAIDSGLDAIIKGTEYTNEKNVGEIAERLFRANATEYQAIDDIRTDPGTNLKHVTTIRTIGNENWSTVANRTERLAQSISSDRQFEARPGYNVPTIQPNQVQSKMVITVIPQNHSHFLSNPAFIQQINNIAKQTKVFVNVVPMGGWIRKK